MARRKTEELYVTEHIFEVRHAASGTFLNVRGLIADYIKAEGLFPHWKIASNVVHFRDQQDEIAKFGAFIGYNNVGYIALNPETKNLFSDKSNAFWKAVEKNKAYSLPPLARFGARTKVFATSDKGFEVIYDKIFRTFFNEGVIDVIGGKGSDLQVILDVKESPYDVRFVIGPIHKDEAGKYFSFKSEHFNSSGVFIDIDCHKSEELSSRGIPNLVRGAMEVTWKKIDDVLAALEL